MKSNLNGNKLTLTHRSVVVVVVVAVAFVVDDVAHDELLVLFLA